MNRSPLFYVGDKFKLMGQLKNLFPKDINTFFDPFCGGGSVFLNTEAKEYKVNDFNKHVISIHNYLSENSSRQTEFFDILEKTILSYGLSASYLGKTAPDELKRKYKKTYYAVMNKEAYHIIRNDFNRDQSNTLLLYILLIYGFNHMIRFNGKGQFNLPIGNVDYNKNVRTSLEDYFTFMSSHRVTFFSQDYEDFLLGSEIKKNDFVYLDPPYLISESEYNKDWTEEEEKRLLSFLDRLNEKNISFGLSNVLSHKGKENLILKEWSQKYTVNHLKANYISFNDNTIKQTDEVYISNI